MPNSTRMSLPNSCGRSSSRPLPIWSAAPRWPCSTWPPHYRDLSDGLRKAVNERVDDEYGLDIPQLMIVNVSLPEDVEKAVDTRSSMGIVGDMDRFQQFQMGNAMTAAANNPAGGGAAEGMGLGIGLAMANRIAGIQSKGVQTPPPLPGAVAANWHIAVNGQTQGPFTLPQIAQGISGGPAQPRVARLEPGNGVLDACRPGATARCGIRGVCIASSPAAAGAKIRPISLSQTGPSLPRAL